MGGSEKPVRAHRDRGLEISGSISILFGNIRGKKLHRDRGFDLLISIRLRV
jgi:hypothetical protein